NQKELLEKQQASETKRIRIERELGQSKTEAKRLQRQIEELEKKAQQSQLYQQRVLNGHLLQSSQTNGLGRYRFKHDSQLKQQLMTKHTVRVKEFWNTIEKLKRVHDHCANFNDPKHHTFVETIIVYEKKLAKLQKPMGVGKKDDTLGGCFAKQKHLIKAIVVAFFFFFVLLFTCYLSLLFDCF
ncbi:hypothetical protein RFI_33805, partial [Reticulomyxa filosa]